MMFGEWARLSPLNLVFLFAALFFSTLFVWQLLSLALGLFGDHGGVDTHTTSGNDAGHVDAGHVDAGHVDAGHADTAGIGGDHGDVHGDMHTDAHGPAEVHGDASHAAGHEHAQDHGGLSTLRLFSVRSIIAFGTLFSWAATLYLRQNLPPPVSLGFAFLWGFAGMLVVALFFWALPRLGEEGNANLETAIGQTGQVYLDIPAQGVGQVRVLVSGAVSYVKARSFHELRIPAGRKVRVVGLTAQQILEVEEVPSQE